MSPATRPVAHKGDFPFFDFCPSFWPVLARAIFVMTERWRPGHEPDRGGSRQQRKCPSPTGRFTFTSWRLWKGNDALAESGLILKKAIGMAANERKEHKENAIHQIGPHSPPGWGAIRRNFGLICFSLRSLRSFAAKSTALIRLIGPVKLTIAEKAVLEDNEEMSAGV
jgi:hypothetical protein